VAGGAEAPWQKAQSAMVNCSGQVVVDITSLSGLNLRELAQSGEQAVLFLVQS
jgi:hypothetical protein